MWRWVAIGSSVVVVSLIAAGMLGLNPARSSSWLRLTSPGPLSKAHSFIGNNCAACHASVAGVTREKCITCHANDAALLDQQPTAFHATIGECAPCHFEHVAGVRRPIYMDHVALARIGLAQLGNGPKTEKQERARLLNWARSGSVLASNPTLGAQERLLNCVSCHQVQDVHTGNFGQDCALCHATKTWFIAGYVHPSPASLECAQCHTATPCHYMKGCLGMMGEMAGAEGARVEQCYRCHKTTSWYDYRQRDR